MAFLVPTRRPPLGQHFLHSPAILDRLAACVCAAARESDLVVEIGAGRGPLTRRLVDLGLRVTAIEIDPRLAETLYASCPGVEVVQGDVLQVDFARLIPDRAVVAGNLPYYITSPILRKLCDAAARISEAILLVQEEVARRVVAQPGGRDFGYLSVLCQAHARPDLLFTVPPEAFRPPPKVVSAVVRLVMEQRYHHWGVEDRDEFLRFVQLCFHQKRKTLRNNLQGRFGKEPVAGLAEGGQRAEQLSPEQLAAVWRQFGAATGKGAVRCSQIPDII